MYVYRSGNPALSDATFEKSSYSESDWWDDDSHLMSMEGTAEKTAILLIITATAGIATAMMMPAAALLVIVGFLGGFITAMIVIFSGSTNPALICTYAAFEGLALGGMTWFFEQAFPGIGLQAMLLTFLILGSMLLIYRAGLIAWNQNLAIAVFSSLLSLFVIGIGALCLVADFDFIEKGVERGAPKQLEWRAAFGLMVTLVWLYLEILKLLAKLKSR
jgi:uncharacterized YccA/Bax inhibitor family protein